MTEQLTFAETPKRVHIVIMKKSWGLTPKILSGAKTIESRWYMHKVAPWGRIETDDDLYFKDSGEPVTVKAKVRGVVTFEDLKPGQSAQILAMYGGDDGIGVDDIAYFGALFNSKRYCMLVGIKDAEPCEPFRINKSGFGSQAAWLITDDIRKLTEANEGSANIE